jgi:DNA-binding SARP family transcriptional activator
MAITFTVLGPVEARTNGQPVTLFGKRGLALLAGLLMAPNTVISGERLIEWVWGECPPTHPRSTLQNAVSRLRQVLGQDVITTSAPGYRLVTDARHLDLLMFDQLIAAADANRRRAPEKSVELLGRAIGLWRPPLLANVEAPLLRRYAAGLLDERYLTAHEERARLCLRLGRHTEVIAVLSDLVAAYPFREPLAEQLMVGLLRGGRRADALVTYQTLRQVLGDELGVEPNATLQELHRRILRDPDLTDAAASPGIERDVTTIAGSRGVRHPDELPAPIRRFHGRTTELADLDRRLLARDPARPSAVVAIVGAAGIGKTALAVQWANRARARFPDGQLYVDLAGFDGSVPVEPADALVTLLGSLGVERRAIPADARARAAQFRSVLASRRMLIMLDNARDSEQVRRLLPGGGRGCVVVVTSRDQLRGLVARDGADRVEVGELGTRTAKALLCDFTGWAPERFPDGVVADLVHVCAGLPLALRIVAERLVRDRDSVPGVVAQLSRCAAMPDRSLPFGTLLDELCTGDDGSTSIRELLSGSTGTLDPETVRGYGELGLHPADELSAEAAALLLGQSTTSARRLLDRLTAVHLVRRDHPDLYHIPALVRAHAGETHDAIRRAAPALTVLGPATSKFLVKPAPTNGGRVGAR